MSENSENSIYILWATTQKYKKVYIATSSGKSPEIVVP